jgi:hypothetical protein
VVAVGAFLVAVLSFLSSVVFAINAQANNYLRLLELSDTALRRLAVPDAGVWLRRVERRWQVWHLAAIWTFYAGAVLFLAGVNLIIWVYVGATLGLLLLLALVVNFGLGALVFRLSRH